MSLFDFEQTKTNESPFQVFFRNYTVIILMRNLDASAKSLIKTSNFKFDIIEFHDDELREIQRFLDKTDFPFECNHVKKKYVFKFLFMQHKV